MAEKVDKTGYAVQMSHERKQHTAIVWVLHLLCTAEIEEWIGHHNSYSTTTMIQAGLLETVTMVLIKPTTQISE